MSDLELLRRYSRDHSEEAFAELVRRHIDWVYSVCRRLVRDPGLAEDVTQAAFLTLARKASTLSDSVSISGWLFTTARYASASALKIEHRRRLHERQAATMTQEATIPDSQRHWPQIEPVLDDALARLSAPDREAVILRFFRGMSHQAIGASLEISEEAAKKRVSRAIDRLRKRLGSAATTVTAATVATLVTERATQAAPLQLADKSVMSIKAGPAGRTQLIVKGMSTMQKVAVFKIVLGVAAAVLITSAATVAIVDQHNPTPPPTAPVGAAIDPALKTLGPFDISAVQTFCIAGVKNGLTFTTYYRRQKGIVQHFFAPGWSAVDFVLGRNEWERRDDGSLIMQKIPTQDSAAMISSFEADLSSLQNARVTRDHNSDAEIEGAQCEAYRLQDAPEKFKKAVVYIDPATNRPARIKTDDFLLDMTITYDPSVPDSVFADPTLSGSTVVTARELLEKKYPLEGALFTKEGVGQIFAVHEATQDVAGCYHIICSSRPIPKVRAALNDLPDNQGIGKFVMDDRAGFPFHYISLAEFAESGLQVMYLLAIPDKLPPADDICRLPVTMGSSDVLLDAAHISHTPHSGHDVHIGVQIRVPLKPNSPSAMQFEARAYDDVAPLVGLVSYVEMTGPGFMTGLSTKQDTLIEVRQRLARYLSDEQIP